MTETATLNSRTPDMRQARQRNLVALLRKAWPVGAAVMADERNFLGRTDKLKLTTSGTVSLSFVSGYRISFVRCDSKVEVFNVGQCYPHPCGYQEKALRPATLEEWMAAYRECVGPSASLSKCHDATCGKPRCWVGMDLEKAYRRGGAVVAGRRLAVIVGYEPNEKSRETSKLEVMPVRSGLEDAPRIAWRHVRPATADEWRRAYRAARGPKVKGDNAAVTLLWPYIDCCPDPDRDTAWPSPETCADWSHGWARGAHARRYAQSCDCPWFRGMTSVVPFLNIATDYQMGMVRCLHPLATNLGHSWGAEEHLAVVASEVGLSEEHRKALEAVHEAAYLSKHRVRVR